MSYLYTIAIYLLLPFVLLRLFYLSFKNPDYRKRWLERFGFFYWEKSTQPIIWLHAVSVGEVNAARPLVLKLQESYPEKIILITTVTPTGALTVKHHFGNDVYHFYLPYDLPFAVNQFLKKIQPEILITMETEIWPNLYRVCQSRAIPVLIINARLSQKSAGGYKLLSILMKQTLQRVDLIAAQNDDDAKRFISLGANPEKVSVSGNLKFDIDFPASITEQAQSLKRQLSVNRPLWIAASTQEGEDEKVLHAHKQILTDYPNAILMLAPRHPERIPKIISLCHKFEFKFKKRTDQASFPEDCQVYLLDTLGELQLHYAASEVAFVGGSLVKTGGQNMMEPASLGLPVITGPHTFNFSEITRLLHDEGVLLIVQNGKELAETVKKLLADANLRHKLGEKARDVIKGNRGNIKRLMKLLKPYLQK